MSTKQIDTLWTRINRGLSKNPVADLVKVLTANAARQALLNRSNA